MVSKLKNAVFWVFFNVIFKKPYDFSITIMGWYSCKHYYIENQYLHVKKPFLGSIGRMAIPLRGDTGLITQNLYLASSPLGQASWFHNYNRLRSRKRSS